MAIAEIHGKNPALYSEDLLTADVFGAFRYLPIRRGIFDFLCSIPGLGQQLPLLAENEEVACTFHFWPVGEKQRREPDVLLELQVGSRFIHVVVEAKYLSGASDWELEELEQGGQTEKVGNQLGDQWRDVQHGWYRVFNREGQRVQQLTLKSDPSDRYLLYVTAHVIEPNKDFQRAFEANPALRGNLFWSNWSQIYEHFQRMHSAVSATHGLPILHDICLLLARKGFASFYGFRPLPVGDINRASASFWKGAYLNDPIYKGITLPPSFSVPSGSFIFWRGG